ncbi:MAG TPA: hypothetical protein VLL47_08450, partial [Robiginitalea sp.]|nr:hypothetical protein [Robiginitalea sp.]
MKTLIKYGICLLLTLQAARPQDGFSEGPFSQLIIRGATLINGNGAPPMGPVDIVVENNRITRVESVGYPGVAIDPKDRPVLKPGGREIQAEGMYVLPGFIDMHGHIGGTAQGAEPDYVFKLWMGHGITSVRETAGRGVDFAMDLKRRSAANQIVAPRIFAYTGFGQESNGPITTPEQAREWVRQNARKGADGIKFFGAA